MTWNQGGGAAQLSYILCPESPLGDDPSVISSSKTGTYRWSSPPGTCWDPDQDGTGRRKGRVGGLKACTESPGTAGMLLATVGRCPCSPHHHLHSPPGTQDCPVRPEEVEQTAPSSAWGRPVQDWGPFGPCVFQGSHKAHGVVMRPQGGHLCGSHLQILKCHE